MNAREAREIVKNNAINAEYWEAKGYLAALEGPEVKALVEALEDAIIACDQRKIFYVGKWRKALVAYKEAVGKPGEGERG